MPGLRPDRRFVVAGFASAPPGWAPGAVCPVKGEDHRSEAGGAGAAIAVPTRINIRIHRAAAAQIAGLRFALFQLIMDWFVTVSLTGSFGRN